MIRTGFCFDIEEDNLRLLHDSLIQIPMEYAFTRSSFIYNFSYYSIFLIISIFGVRYLRWSHSSTSVPCLWLVSMNGNITTETLHANLLSISRIPLLFILVVQASSDVFNGFEMDATESSLLEIESSLQLLSEAIASGEVDESVLDQVYEEAAQETDHEASVSYDICPYTCPNDKKPFSRPGYKPGYNGCGAAGEGPLAKTVREYLSRVPSLFVQCCNNHDLCYGTCNASRYECDVSFNVCLKSAVSRFLKLPMTARTLAQGTCIALGLDNVFYTAVAVMGCPAYKSAQREACVCR